ncbi:D-amino-acid transaminase [Saccharococcus caldoxylosilyticus]|jgi:D-alanine transaminase|uniref:D-alanine aminotransferase n=2 Tax=Saccharococcus caldoxylosilyticus TaxID=81408 RepID=A0A023DE31_9BACL|nr:D-amino-acid transaminase [Parageobacillus caldoxylosilyticus]OQP03525.1 D-amino-acid transaminase [Geobacillus sp. 44B]KYD18035.1 D-alanine aminotransferase [Parageobacillus caldoxylosilyticus]MBB3852767.1 D-alanine transaminase [Parageobacillus caldoxylosilyticus]QNU38183.1 D-amino-acid transaminase [Geobacillus sp. 44B]GAJ39549.1 D-alanine aminotransferase [Parageobacillus caldoxylosilyticus NBRC 107762]
MTLKPYVLTEKQFLPYHEVTYPMEERGLQFGDGIYEVTRIYQGMYFLLEEHIDRLYRSAASIRLSVPFDKDVLMEKLEQLREMNDVKEDAILYLQVTRGSFPRNHAFPTENRSNLYAYIREMPRKINEIEQGVRAILTKDVRWEYCYIKSLNLLPNVLAKQEAVERRAFEAIFHRDGIITEGSSSNIFLVKDGNIYTHPATERILNGIVRMKVKQFCSALGIPFVEEAFSINDIAEAEEMFLTSTTSSIIPIIQVEDQIIGDGKPGELTRKLQAAYEKAAGLAVKSGK